MLVLFPFLGLLVTPAAHQALTIAVPMGGRLPLRCSAVVLQSVSTEANGAAADTLMPPELAAWGCDEELWGKIKGAKGSLRKLARDGDETRARARLANIRRNIAEDEANPEAAAARLTAKAQEKAAVKQVLKSATKGSGSEERAREFTNARAAGAKGARPLKSGYELFGSIPDGFDGAAAEALVSGTWADGHKCGWDRRDGR